MKREQLRFLLLTLFLIFIFLVFSDGKNLNRHDIASFLKNLSQKITINLNIQPYFNPKIGFLYAYYEYELPTQAKKYSQTPVANRNTENDFQQKAKTYEQFLKQINNLEQKLMKIKNDIKQIQNLKENYIRNPQLANKNKGNINHVYEQEQYLIQYLNYYTDKKNLLKENFSKNIQFDNSHMNPNQYRIYLGAFHNMTNAYQRSKQIENIGIGTHVLDLWNNNEQNTELQQNHLHTKPNQDSECKKNPSSNSFYPQNKKIKKEPEFADFTYFSQKSKVYTDAMPPRKSSSMQENRQTSLNSKKDIDPRYLNFDLYKKSKVQNNFQNNDLNKEKEASYRVLSKQTYNYVEAQKIVEYLNKLGYEAYLKKT